MEQVPAQDDHGATLPDSNRRPRATARSRCAPPPYTAALAAPLPHRGRAVAGRAGRPARPRAGAQGRAARLARARAPHRRARVRASVDADAHLVRGRDRRARGPPDGAAARRAAAHARRVGARHGARALAPRRGDRAAHRVGGDPRRAGRARHRARREHALARSSPVPGARRPAHAARGARRPARPAADLRRRRQQHGPLARGRRRARRPGGHGGRTRRLPARGRDRRAAHRRPRGGAPRAPTCSTPTSGSR